MTKWIKLLACVGLVVLALGLTPIGAGASHCTCTGTNCRNQTVTVPCGTSSAVCGADLHVYTCVGGKWFAGGPCTC